MSIIAAAQDEGLFLEDEQKPYRWEKIPGTNHIRPVCREHGRMQWHMKISKDYPPQISKHTRTHHAHPVVFRGLLVQAYRCRQEGCETAVQG